MLITSKEFAGGGGAVNLVLVNTCSNIANSIFAITFYRANTSFSFGIIIINYVTLQLCVCLCLRKYKLWQLILFLYINYKSTEIFIFSSLHFLKKSNNNLGAVRGRPAMSFLYSIDVRINANLRNGGYDQEYKRCKEVSNRMARAAIAAGGRSILTL